MAATVLYALRTHANVLLSDITHHAVHTLRIMQYQMLLLWSESFIVFSIVGFILKYPCYVRD